MFRLLLPALLVSVASISAQQGSVRSIRVCGDPSPFRAAAATRDLVVHARVVSAPDPRVDGRPHGVRVEVVEVLKGRVDAPVFDVVVDNRRIDFRTADEWLLALPGVGTPFIDSCGVYAVPVRDGEAVGRIDSIASDQAVPVEQLRPRR